MKKPSIMEAPRAVRMLRITLALKILGRENPSAIPAINELLGKIESWVDRPASQPDDEFEASLLELAQIYKIEPLFVAARELAEKNTVGELELAEEKGRA